MTEHHRAGKDGILGDGVGFRQAGEADIQTYRDAERQLATHRMPVLLPANDPNARLFVACFDGTGNDAAHDPEHAINIGYIRSASRSAQS